MKTAEEIIQEYLDRGYSLESLRILAESREEPLGGHMLAVINRLEAAAAPAAAEESGMADVPCETGSYARVGEEMVFFVAGDEAPADGGSVDFDLMAETLAEIPASSAAPAVEAESVADIVVGETDGADVVSYRTEAVEAVEPAEPETAAEDDAENGIWSRLWSKVSPTAAPALAPSMAEEREMAAVLEVAPPEEEDAFAEERPLFAEVEETVEENAAETVEESAEETGDEVESIVDEYPLNESPADESPLEDVVLSEDTVILEEIAAGAEISADYIPGSALLPVLREASELGEEPVEQAEPVEPVAEQLPEVPAAAKRESRREKRRRERREKKKAVRDRKQAEAALPEIVLTRSEGTETLVPEMVSILTPDDVVAPAEEEAGDSRTAPEALALLSAHAFALVASLTAMSCAELAKAREIIEQDRAAALAIELNNAEAVLENTEDIENVENVENTEETGENNIILFRDKFPVFAGESDGEEGEGEEEDCFEPFLHILSAEETEDVSDPEADYALAVSSCEVAEEAVEQLLLTAAEEEGIAETAEEAAEEIAEEIAEEVAEEVAEERIEEQAVLPAEDPAAELQESLLEREAALRLRIEEEYQTRLDEFALRLLEAQTLASESENRVAEKKAELDARSAILEEMRRRLAAEEEKQSALLRKLDEATAALRGRDGELAELNGLREEHGRLYAEFEDLRKAYNEVVTDVMPELQNERDDLAMTVERQCAKEHTLKTSLRSTRKRLAAGYVLGAAACLMLVTLPVANWLRSDEDSRKLAVDHQLFSELRGTLDVQVQQNVDAQTRILELERKITRARDEIARLDTRNRELASLAAGQHSQGIAVFKPEEGSDGGTPTRAMTMALQATVPPGGRLHVNEVMDPAGSIEQLQMANRERNAASYREEEAQMARSAQPSGSSGAALPIAALVSVDSGAGSLRPQAQGGAAVVRRESADLRPSGAAARSGGEIVTAKVKKGEGVAQVVYRVLNTRDPEVIAWVIEENNIRTDRRGNPVIQPNQELRLPRDGNVGQAASALRAPRR